MDEFKHVSQEEKKKWKLIRILVTVLILIALIIIIIMIPKGSTPTANSITQAPTTIQKTVERSQTQNTSSQNQTNTTETKDRDTNSAVIEANANVNTNKTNNSSNYLDIISKDKSKVSITIKSGTLTVDGAVIVITDTNISPYSWSPIYKLQQKIDGVWQDMELKNPENMIFPDLLYNNTTGVMEQSLIWSNKYGQVGVGQYRIVKETDGMEFYAEFEVQ